MLLKNLKSPTIFMASFTTISRSIIFLYFFTFFFKLLIAADSNTSFSFNNFAKDSTFIALYGDAKLVNGGVSSLQLTDSSPSSAGRVIYKKPITIYGGIPNKLVSFSSYFSFSMSDWDSLAFVLFPYGYPLNVFSCNATSGILSKKKFRLLSVEFGYHIGIDSSRFMSVKVMNLSSVNLMINGSEKMQTWIDYEAGSKRLEVRLNRFGRNRPTNPQLFVQIDMLKIWPRNELVFVGLSSSNGNSSKTCDIHSWRFKASRAPDWMHSQPLDPMGSKFNQEHEMKVVPKESDCVMKILAALITGIGCGSLGTFVVMFMFTIFGKRNKQVIVPEEFIVKSLQEYEHKKLKIVLDEAVANEN